MRIAALRPYFAPYPGFFRIASAAEVVVILDLVQLPRGTTWLTRNRFKNAQGALWLTVPVWRKGRGLQRLADVRLCDEGRWRYKHVESLRASYVHAPYLRDHLPFLEGHYAGGEDRLVPFNVAIIRHVMESLGISTPLVLQSSLGVCAAGTALLAALCRCLGARELVVPAGAEDRLDRRALDEAGVRLLPLRSRPRVYPQLWGPFLANLSTLDVLFTCGPRACEVVLGCDEGEESAS